MHFNSPDDCLIQVSDEEAAFVYARRKLKEIDFDCCYVAGITKTFFCFSFSQVIKIKFLKINYFWRLKKGYLKKDLN